MNRPLLLLGLCAILLGCVSTKRERLSFDDGSGAPVHLVPERAWELREGQEVLGHVVLFNAQDDGRRRYYSVRNNWQQELGLVDELGRIWRFRPFEQEPEWMGSGSVVEGARLILDLGPAAALHEVELAGLVEAATKRNSGRASRPRSSARAQR